jgi:hypothetical protein
MGPFRVITIALALPLIACGDRVCAGVGYSSVAVTVLDSITGARRERDASVLVYALDRHGILLDSARGRSDSIPIYAAWDAGLMRVVVQRPGYVTWTQPAVLVRKDSFGCNVVTERLLARLQPAG